MRIEITEQFQRVIDSLESLAPQALFVGRTNQARQLHNTMRTTYTARVLVHRCNMGDARPAKSARSARR